MSFSEIHISVIFAALAILVSFIRYGTYLWSIYKKETKPHVFSWFNWGVLVGIGAYAQLQLEGGPSAWVLMFVSFTCFFITLVSLFVGEKNITKSDWIAFISALLAIPVWMVTDNPFYAMIIVVLIDSLSYYPTIRKSWHDPWGEPPVSYLWAGLRYFLAIFAVPDPTMQTIFYPLFLTSTDWGFAIFLFWRRRSLSSQLTSPLAESKKI